MFNLKPLAALLVLSAALPALAASSASSASSDSVSTSVGGISGSFEKSSDSSKGDKKTAGDYKVIDVAAAPNRPGITRMTLQAVADASADGEFYLYVPHAVAQQSGVAAGQTIVARERPYGLEFAHKADSASAFFLLLGDDWLRELNTKVVTL